MYQEKSGNPEEVEKTFGDSPTDRQKKKKLGLPDYSLYNIPKR
jgi:hypothetical protein